MKEPSNFGISTQDNLENHRYAYFIERPGWAYIGATSRAAKSYQRLAHAIGPSSMPGNSFRWSRYYQGEAIKHGFFLHRSGDRERVNIISVDTKSQIHFHNDNGAAAMAWLETKLFEHPRGNTIFHEAWKFIKQQDQFGYVGAWERGIEFWSNRLIWYKGWHASQKSRQATTPHSRAVEASMERRIAASTKAQNWAYASHLNRTWINPKDGKPKPHVKAVPTLPKPKRGRPSYGQSQMSKRLPGGEAHDDQAISAPPKSNVKRSKFLIKNLFRQPEGND